MKGNTKIRHEKYLCNFKCSSIDVKVLFNFKLINLRSQLGYSKSAYEICKKS